MGLVFNPFTDELDFTGSGGGGGSGTSLTKTITQTSHGFSVGNVVYFNGTIYVKAKTDISDTSDAVGIVSTVTDANTFVLTLSGYVSGLSGLVAGTIYFLSDATAGLLTATEPTSAGHVSKPLLDAISTTEGYFYNWRGMIIGSGGPSGSTTQVQFNNAGFFGADSEFTYDSTNDRLFIGSSGSGSEMITNGDFSSGSTGWNPVTGFAWASNKMYFGGTGGGVSQTSFPATTAGWYRYSYTVSNFTGAADLNTNFTIYDGVSFRSSGNVVGAGTYTGIIYVGNCASPSFSFNVGQAHAVYSTFDADNFSFKRVAISTSTTLVAAGALAQNGYQVIDQSTASAPNLSVATAAYATNANYATSSGYSSDGAHATLSDMTYEFVDNGQWRGSYYLLRDYNQPSNNINSGSLTLFYTASLASQYIMYNDGDFLTFEFAGLAQATGMYVTFHLGFGDGGYSKVLVFPSVQASGTGNNLWVIRGTVVRQNYYTAHMTATLDFSYGSYNNCDTIVDPSGTANGYRYFGNTNAGGGTIGMSGFYNPQIALSVEDNSGSGYVAGTYGWVKKF